MLVQRRERRGIALTEFLLLGREQAGQRRVRCGDDGRLT